MSLISSLEGAPFPVGPSPLGLEQARSLSRGLPHLCICRSGWRTSVATVPDHPGFAGCKDHPRAWCRLAPPCTGPGPPESHRHWPAPHPVAGSTPWTASCPLSCRPGGTAPRLQAGFHSPGNRTEAPTEGDPWLCNRRTPSRCALLTALRFSSCLPLLSSWTFTQFLIFVFGVIWGYFFVLHSIPFLIKKYPQNHRTHACARVYMHMHRLFYVIQTTKTNLIPLEAPLTTRFNEGGTSHHLSPVKSGFV